MYIKDQLLYFDKYKEVVCFAKSPVQFECRKGSRSQSNPQGSVSQSRLRLPGSFVKPVWETEEEESKAQTLTAFAPAKISAADGSLKGMFESVAVFSWSYDASHLHITL